MLRTLFITAKTWKQLICPSTEKGIKRGSTYIQWNFSHKKNEIMPFATTWMNLELTILSEVSQAEEDKYMISLICGILKNHTNELVYKT